MRPRFPQIAPRPETAPGVTESFPLSIGTTDAGKYCDDARAHHAPTHNTHSKYYETKINLTGRSGLLRLSGGY